MAETYPLQIRPTGGQVGMGQNYNIDPSQLSFGNLPTVGQKYQPPQYTVPDTTGSQIGQLGIGVAATIGSIIGSPVLGAAIGLGGNAILGAIRAKKEREANEKAQRQWEQLQAQHLAEWEAQRVMAEKTFGLNREQFTESKKQNRIAEKERTRAYKTQQAESMRQRFMDIINTDATLRQNLISLMGQRRAA